MTKKSEPRFLQTKNPRTKQWVKIDAETGKVIAIKKTPGKYKGISIARLSKSASPKSTGEPKISKETKAEIFRFKTMIRDLTMAHLYHVKNETGKVTQVDKTYCKDLANRMLKKKFPTLKLQM